MERASWLDTLMQAFWCSTPGRVKRLLEWPVKRRTTARRILESTRLLLAAQVLIRETRSRPVDVDQWAKTTLYTVQQARKAELREWSLLVMKIDIFVSLTRIAVRCPHPLKD